MVMKLPFFRPRLVVAAPSLRFVTLVGTALLVFASSTQGQSAPDGEWAGALRLPSETLYVRVNVTRRGSDATVLSALPRPLSAVGAKWTALGFELRLVGGADTLQLQRVRRGDTLSGGVARQRGGGDFTFVRVMQVNPEPFDEYAGGYELPSGRLVFITRGDRFASKPPFNVERSCTWPLSERAECLTRRRTSLFSKSRSARTPSPRAIGCGRWSWNAR